MWCHALRVDLISSPRDGKIRRQSTCHKVNWNERGRQCFPLIGSAETYDKNKIQPWYMSGNYLNAGKWSGKFDNMATQATYSMCIFALIRRFQKEFQLIKRNKASKIFICSCYKTHVSCLRQPIPMANARDGALPVCLWPAWLTLLFWEEEVCVYRGHGADFTGLWLEKWNASEGLHPTVAQVGRERAQGSPQTWIQQGHCFSSSCPWVHSDI